MLAAGDPLADRQQRSELIPGGGRIPGLPSPAGQVGARGKCVGVLGAPGFFPRVKDVPLDG